MAQVLLTRQQAHWLSVGEPRAALGVGLGAQHQPWTPAPASAGPYLLGPAGWAFCPVR